MNFDFFRGIYTDLTNSRYVDDWVNFVQFWNDHNSGVRTWDNINATTATITTETVTTLTATTGLFGDGTVGAPGIAFSGDTDVGWYRIGANNPALSAGNAKVIDAKSTGVAVLGTTTNDNAAAGFIGEYIESAVSNVAAAATNQYQDTTTISLTAGDWMVNGFWYPGPSVNTTLITFGLSSGTAGNAFSDSVAGDNEAQWNIPAGTVNMTTTLTRRYSLSATTTLRLKTNYSYTAGSPATWGRLSAWRMR